MQMQNHHKTELPELAGYFSVPNAHLYTVLHQVENPVARLLLVGPFAAERHYAYRPMVCWARYLAENGVEVLRYDYRGVGESTGVFEEMNFAHWNEDVRILAGWLANRSPNVPLILHGLEMGALLAARRFSEGTGDALLLWASPVDANQVLRSVLLRWAGLEKLWESSESRKPASQYIRRLEQGSSIEVHGYQWSSRLWRESLHCDLPSALRDEALALRAYEKPVKSVRFREDAKSLVMPYARHPDIADLSSLYSNNFNWITKILTPSTGGINEGGD